MQSRKGDYSKQHLIRAKEANIVLQFFRCVIMHLICSNDGIGRHSGLKIRWSNPCGFKSRFEQASRQKPSRGEAV